MTSPSNIQANQCLTHFAEFVCRIHFTWIWVSLTSLCLTSVSLAETHLFQSQTEFESFAMSQGGLQTGVETFAGKRIDPGNLVVFIDDPLEPDVGNITFDGQGYPDGLSVPNLRIQSNLGPNPQAATENPRGSSGLAVDAIEPNNVSAAWFPASLDLIFTDPQQRGAGFWFTSRGFQPWPDTTDFSFAIFDQAGDELARSTVADVVVEDGSFFGVWSDEAIGRINLFDLNNTTVDFGAEAVSNVEMWSVSSVQDDTILYDTVSEGQYPDQVLLIEQVSDILAQPFAVGKQVTTLEVTLPIFRDTAPTGTPSGEINIEVWSDVDGRPDSLYASVGTVELEALPPVGSRDDLLSLVDRRDFATLVAEVDGLQIGSIYHLVVDPAEATVGSNQRYGIGTFQPSDHTNDSPRLLLGSGKGAWEVGSGPASYLHMTINALAAILGDFDGSRVLDAADIDLLSEQIRNSSNDRDFDLNDDGSLTDVDRQIWIELLAGTILGDADLDGTVNFSDFLALSAGFGKPGGWTDGDVDGNGQVEFPDFLALSANFGQSSAVLATVPEPASIWLLNVAALAVVMRRGLRLGKRMV